MTLWCPQVSEVVHALAKEKESIGGTDLTPRTRERLVDEENEQMEKAAIMRSMEDMEKVVGAVGSAQSTQGDQASSATTALSTALSAGKGPVYEPNLYLSRLMGHRKSIRQCVISEQAHLVASVSDDGTSKIWDLTKEINEERGSDAVLDGKLRGISALQLDPESDPEKQSALAAAVA